MTTTVSYLEPFEETDIEAPLNEPLSGLSVLEAFCKDAGVQIDNTGAITSFVPEAKPRTVEDRLMALILQTKKPATPTVRDLPPEDKAAYMREAKRKSRAAAKARKAAGTLNASADTVREVLADAAIAILAKGGDQAESVRKALMAAFPGKPGVWVAIEAEARNGKLAPKHLKL